MSSYIYCMMNWIESGSNLNCYSEPIASLLIRNGIQLLSWIRFLNFACSSVEVSLCKFEREQGCLCINPLSNRELVYFFKSPYNYLLLYCLVPQGEPPPSWISGDEQPPSLPSPAMSAYASCIHDDVSRPPDRAVWRMQMCSGKIYFWRAYDIQVCVHQWVFLFFNFDRFEIQALRYLPISWDRVIEFNFHGPWYCLCMQFGLGIILLICLVSISLLVISNSTCSFWIIIWPK